MFGPSWPKNGEFDMFEVVNDGNQSKTSIHTAPGCVMSTVPGIDNGGDGATVNSDDGAGVWGNLAGPALNDIGGGFYAVEWTSKGFAMYFFPRNGTAPEDITSDCPNTSTWGTPWRFFPFGPSCPPSSFADQRVVFDLTFCGQWAGNVYPGGIEQCNEDVSSIVNPEAYWAINSMKVFPVWQ